MNIKEKIFSTNFALNLVLLLGGLFVGFSEVEASKLVMTVVSVIGSVGLFRTFFKNAQLDAMAWIRNANTWGYIGQIGIVLFPQLTPELFSGIRQIIESAVGGNWQAVVSAIFALIPIIYNLFKKRVAV